MTNTDQRFVGNQDTSSTIAPFRSWSRSAISIDIPAIGNPRSADGATARRSSGSAPLEMGTSIRDAQQNACLYRYKRCFANCIRFKNTGGSSGGAGIRRLKRTHAQANPRPCLGPHCAAGSTQGRPTRHNATTGATTLATAVAAGPPLAPVARRGPYRRGPCRCCPCHPVHALVHAQDGGQPITTSRLDHLDT